MSLELDQQRAVADDHRPAAGWPVATPPSSYVIGNARVVLDDRVTDPASVIIRDGLIAEVVERVLPGDLDAGGRLLLPGLIDVHSDALEKERAPRSNAVLPWDFALTSYEAKLVAAGVTTIFHGAGFQHKAARGTERSPELALELCEAVEGHRTARVDHRILHRFSIRSEGGAALLRRRLEELPAGQVPLVSHEDHTPGQGQYADPKVLIDAIIGDGGMEPEAAEERVTEILADAARTEPIRDANLAWLGELARAGRIRLLGHDPDTAAAIDELQDRGATTAEFPTTLEAARRARELGLTSVAGAPNVLRGRSHSGNVAAADLIELGLVDALASDYLPSALLGAVITLVRSGTVGLPAAVRLITAGPAAVAGLPDRGRIADGLLADLTLVDDTGPGWPRVLTTFKSPVGRADQGVG
jgi:alpha-D-ribose 1-methylphosphonate 5-triphosphate diphosphatase